MLSCVVSFGRLLVIVIIPLIEIEKIEMVVVFMDEWQQFLGYAIIALNMKERSNAVLIM